MCGCGLRNLGTGSDGINKVHSTIFAENHHLGCMHLDYHILYTLQQGFECVKTIRQHKALFCVSFGGAVSAMRKVHTHSNNSHTASHGIIQSAYAHAIAALI